MITIIGGGPAGLAAANQLVQQPIHPIVLEKENRFGGFARTESHKGYRFDIGGHRFYTKSVEVLKLWEMMLGQDLLQVERLSRIYYRNHFFSYPISLSNIIPNLGLGESALTLSSYLQARLHPYPSEKNLEHWLANRFGKRLFTMFFKTYTGKVWGISSDLIDAEWAAQRIKGLSAFSDSECPGSNKPRAVPHPDIPLS